MTKPFAEKERDGCFTFIVCLMSCDCNNLSVLWFLLMVPWVGLQCVTVVFSGHTKFTFYTTCVIHVNCEQLFNEQVIEGDRFQQYT